MAVTVYGQKLVRVSRYKWSEQLCFQLLSSNVVNDLMLLEPLLDNLTARLKDSSASVRRLVLRGLANMASGSPDKVDRPSPPGGQEIQLRGLRGRHGEADLAYHGIGKGGSPGGWVP